MDYRIDIDPTLKSKLGRFFGQNADDLTSKCCLFRSSTAFRSSVSHWAINAAGSEKHTSKDSQEKKAIISIFVKFPLSLRK